MIRNPLAGLLLALTLVLAGCPSSSPSAIWLDGNLNDTSVVDVTPQVDVVVGPAGCETNDDCETGVCNLFTHTCVMCMTDSDCPDKHHCDKWACFELDGCQEDGDCGEGLVCWEAEEVCVECVEDVDCPAGECLDQECVQSCDAGCPEGTLCDELTGFCIECLSDENCLEEEWCYPIESECVEDQCVPGALGCVGDKTAICAENGSGWTGLESCPSDYVCTEGICQDLVVCEAGLISCKDVTTIHICSDDGTKLMEEPCPEGLFCADGKCVEECVADCTGKECGPSNCPGYECGFCPEGSHCEAGTCEAGWCVEGETACDGDAVVYCLGPEEGWSEGKPCPPGSVCSDGDCQNVEPTECAEVLDCMMQFEVEEPDPFFLEKCMGPDPNGDLAIEIFFCVFEMCGNWSPNSGCFEKALKDGECGWLYEECVGGCTPSCWNQECGSDGCGGSCGWCEDGTSCQNGQCIPGGETECAEILECMMSEDCVAPEPWWCMEQCVGPNQDPPDALYGLVECVMMFCGGWFPGDECFYFATEEACNDLYQECASGGCEKQCDGKQCGPNGCDGVCGYCPDNLLCTGAGKCEKPCESQCWSADGTLKECGSDGCGDSCGVCPPGSSCNSGGHCIQVCESDCTESDCGSDGCGGSCGLCDVEEACLGGECVPSLTCEELSDCVWSCPPNDDGCGGECWTNASPAAKGQWTDLFTCVQEVCGPDAPGSCFSQAFQGECSQEWNVCQDCTAECVGKQCGDDGCGGDCGECPGGYVCDNFGTCLCEPQCEGIECGNDGCAGSCGTCGNGETCNAWGFCVCQPKCTLADGTAKECGGNGCGGHCGECQVGYKCNDAGKCMSIGPNSCGNGKCQPGMGENCETCPADCDCDDSCCEEHQSLGCNEPKVKECVCNMDPYCCEQMWDGICVDEAINMCDATCEGGCEPSCFNKECGPDGCEGSCGSCPAGSTCNAGSICEQICEPDCDTEECGSDGCGGSCGLCGVGEACKSGTCVPSLTCNEMLACLWSCPQDDDECGSECWQDASPDAKQQWWALGGCTSEICGDEPDDGCWQMAVQGPCQDEWYACQNCTEDCVGKQCGEDGCGGECGECPGGYVCDNFGGCLCEPQCDDKSCGNDGCGGSCGTCPGGSACNYLGQCVCMPQCGDKECGNDGCGGSCGSCPNGQVCNGAGTCQDAPDKCGNGKCQPGIGENCKTCPEDCGECDSCGNGWCQQGQGETCQNCPEDCGQCTGEGDCCETHDTPSCEDPDVAACVCDMDPFCCNNYWDGLCVSEAEECGANCGGEEQTCETYLDCMMDVTCSNDMPFEMCLFTCAEDGELPGMSKDIVYCVYEVCGAWSPSSLCFEGALKGKCAESYKECVGGGCEPECTIFGFPKLCGDDGCGGSCGTCPWGYECDDNTFQCVESCTPQCNGKECGDDGCDGSCGTCGAGEQCTNGQCGGDYTCADMVDCAVDCGFAVNCTFACMSGGDAESQQLFQALATCIVQSCGFNIDLQCIILSFQNGCGTQYNNCINDGAP